MMRPEDYIRQVEDFAAVSDAVPGTEFLSFYERHRAKIGELLIELKKDNRSTDEFTLRAGMMPPVSAVIDGRIMDFCRLPYRTTDGVIASCPGILYNWKGCPPHSHPVSDTEALLNRAVAFLIVQLEGDQGHERQEQVHPFIDRTSGALREAGYSVIETYACGPCRVCPNGCGDGPECRQPTRRLFALESCGFWVNQLCREAAKSPVLGHPLREVRWIKDWGLPTQDTQSVRFVTGILLDKLPTPDIIGVDYGG